MDIMEEQKNKEKELRAKISELNAELAAREDQLKSQELLLEELYKLVYYKRAWLTLSDDNIRGMQRVVGRLPLEEGCAYPNVMPKTADEYDDNDPWGI